MGFAAGLGGAHETGECRREGVEGVLSGEGEIELHLTVRAGLNALFEA